MTVTRSARHWPSIANEPRFSTTATPLDPWSYPPTPELPARDLRLLPGSKQDNDQGYRVSSGYRAGMWPTTLPSLPQYFVLDDECEPATGAAFAKLFLAGSPSGTSPEPGRHATTMAKVVQADRAISVPVAARRRNAGQTGKPAAAAAAAAAADARSRSRLLSRSTVVDLILGCVARRSVHTLVKTYHNMAPQAEVGGNLYTIPTFAPAGRVLFWAAAVLTQRVHVAGTSSTPATYKPLDDWWMSTLPRLEGEEKKERRRIKGRKNDSYDYLTPVETPSFFTQEQ
ncbi:hypothetical protein CFIO01_11863 [Colletotrichum fioriniae PJ7]|uniref:Uncharacterized protein n=1 Tax=Colletotrichum fioriniae PJ7 TaxID=1445577 RepID=A0A010S5R9_9PEZI|nr:hypothetical protein CFIO01_11863 [Colletotrichum fioriniae PJ7]